MGLDHRTRNLMREDVGSVLCPFGACTVTPCGMPHAHSDSSNAPYSRRAV